MAATVTKTEETFGTIKKVTWTWVSHTDGTVAVATPNAETTNVFSGEILRLITVPAGGASAPTDDYDVYVYDDNDVDALMGAGLNRDTANTEQVLASSLGIVANSKLTLAVANAGDTKGGTVHLYLR